MSRPRRPDSAPPNLASVDSADNPPGQSLAPVDPTDRLVFRLNDLAAALGISRRALERERSAGRFPRPDLTIGRMPLWRPETIRAWIGRGGRL